MQQQIFKYDKCVWYFLKNLDENRDFKHYTTVTPLALSDK